MQNLQETNSKDFQARDWAFTVNNPTQTESQFYDYLKSLSNVRYFIFVKEQGHGTSNNPNGTPHYQGYIEFSQPKKFSTMKKNFSQETIGVNAHLSKRNGSRINCVEYVKKKGSHQDKKDTQIGKIYEYGEFSNGGQRNDLIDMVEMKSDGKSDIEIFEAYPNSYARYESFIDNMALKYKSKGCSNKRDVKVIYVYGPPEVDKAKYVYDLHGYENVYCNQGYELGKWFDGYAGQDVLLLDNYFSDFKINLLLSYLSCQPVTIPCRYRNKRACYTKVYITSTVSSFEQYDPMCTSDNELIEAFRARIDEEISLSKDNETPFSIAKSADSEHDEVF